MPSNSSAPTSPASAGATTTTSIPRRRRPCTSGTRKLPETSPVKRGKLCVRKTTRTASVLPGLVQALERTGDLAILLAQAGDELAHEAESEEHDAADHHRLDEVQQRAKADAEPEAEHEREDTRQEADQEEQRADDAEEQHRLAAEAHLEPHGEQI